LDASSAGLVGEIVVAHRDRLARIGYGLLEHVFLRAGSVLTIVEDNACDGCPEELHEDVMAVLTHFTAKHNGKRSYANRKVARSLKIRILPNAEQKSFKQYAGTARYLHNQAKALAEGVSD
jgi:predicted site-specific integrase-resolvase